MLTLFDTLFCTVFVLRVVFTVRAFWYCADVHCAKLIELQANRDAFIQNIFIIISACGDKYKM